MKLIIALVRILVGVLFILSGLLKLNDPIGFSIKLSEYFSAEVLNLTFLEPYTLWFALFVVIYEIILGVFLLIGFKPKLTLWGLLLMIIFFTFLTFYSAYFNKVTDCGCFGDAVKLSPWGSFTKDLVFLALLLILFAGIRHIKPIFSKFWLVTVSLLSLLACIWFGNYVINHLPAMDFRPYKIGANIVEGMTIPENAPKALVEYKWKFNIDGEEKVITTNGSYPTVDGEFIEVETETIKEGYEPPIHDFSIERGGVDYTNEMLEDPALIVIVAYDLDKSGKYSFEGIKTITDKALNNGYKVIGMTASSVDMQNEIKRKFNLNFDFYFCDETTLKTIVRANPGVLKLNKGTVQQKVHWKDVDQIELPKFERVVFLNSQIVDNGNDKILYLLNDSIISKSDFEKIDNDLIESVNVIKDTLEIKKYTDDDYDGAINIKLKVE